jgi:hypothetical protein
MAKPSGALDITSDTVDPLSIDLEEWNTYIVEGASNVAPLYMYTCSRVPMVPGELQTDGNLSAARLELGISSTGLADEQAVFRTKVFRDRNGTSNTPLGGATLEAELTLGFTATATTTGSCPHPKSERSTDPSRSAGCMETSLSHRVPGTGSVYGVTGNQTYRNQSRAIGWTHTWGRKPLMILAHRITSHRPTMR